MNDTDHLPEWGTRNADGTWTLPLDDATYELLDGLARTWDTDHDGVLRRLLDLPPAAEDLAATDV